MELKSTTQILSATPPPAPVSDPVVAVFDCLTNTVYRLNRTPLIFGAGSDCDINTKAVGFTNGKVMLARSLRKPGSKIPDENRLSKVELNVLSGSPKIEVNGVPFAGGSLDILDSKRDELSIVIDRSAFFFIHRGLNADQWIENVKQAPTECWQMRIFKGGADRFTEWKNLGQPYSFSGMLELENLKVREVMTECNRRNWKDEIGLVHHSAIETGFYAHFFRHEKKAKILVDAGEHRCPRCWLRFEAGTILAIHPSQKGDPDLGETELLRFVPERFSRGGLPVVPDGKMECNRLACPHCRGELPQGFIERPPILISLVGDSMAGKSYFISVAIRQLKRILPVQLGVDFIDADPAGNKALSEMVARLFTPSDNARDIFIDKTHMAGEVFQALRRNGDSVYLPRPFTYRLMRDRLEASVVFYDNAGEQFRPHHGDVEKLSQTGHLASAAGIIFLFDPLQNRDILKKLDPQLDPQIKEMRRMARMLQFDQDLIIAELRARVEAWRGEHRSAGNRPPVAFVLGKHDLLGDIFPTSELNMKVVDPVGGCLTPSAIEMNSRATRSFLVEYCPEVVGAIEAMGDRICYFPASSFGHPAVALPQSKEGSNGNEKIEIGPDPTKLFPYLVEAPFLWLFSQIEPGLFQKSA